MSRADDNAAVAWGSFLEFLDDCHDEFFDGCDGSIIGGGSVGVEHLLVDDSPRTTDDGDDAEGQRDDPAAAEDADVWSAFGDLREGIGNTPDILWGVELPEGASVPPEETIDAQDAADFDSVRNSKDAELAELSLRQWIKRATGENEYVSAVVSSPAYVTSAIKIAIDLTAQIVDAEDLYKSGVHDKLDMLPLSAAHDWAEHVVVQFYDTQSSAGSRQDDIDAQVDGFLHQFEQRRIARQLQVYDNALASEQDSTGQNDLEDVSIHQDAGCLDVKSARIQCPESDSSSNHENTPMRRIFYLGLVFYELFSGGQKPPSKLCALASAERAFVSLSTMALAQNNENDQDQFIGANKRIQRGNRDGGPCRVYCEYLKLSNVTNSLCDLIFNMLDCVCGAFAGKDSYSELREVQFDLQLMLDKPKILRGLNMDELSSQSPRLQLDEIVIPREQEVESILSCYRRCMSGSFEIVVIKGSSGAGKSFLTQLVGGAIVSEGGIFLVGKFDQMHQSRPFSALAAALDQYCGLLIDHLGSDWANTAVEKLQAALGKDASYLIKIIPRLGTILNHNEAYSPPDDQDNNMGNAVQRIQYLLCLFVETISSSSLVAVTLCLDDVQWMDSASISVVRRVLSQGLAKFFFLACCRHDEMSDTHPFWGIIESASSNCTPSVSVELKNIDASILENLISDLLCLPPRLVKPLAGIVHSKTKGLPLFVAEMLRALNRDGLLRVDLDSQRWVWEEDKFRAAKLPDNVALCFTNGIAKLPTEVQIALHVLSMFGSSVKSECIRTLETQLNINLTEELNVAIREGLVGMVTGSYHFSHDWIQETCYRMIEEQERLRNHLTYGRCLAAFAMETNNDDIMFTSANQINLGGPEAITDANEYMTMASYNLMVGKKAIETSDFSLAYKLFSSGIKFLPQRHWHYHYDVSLELHELAAKAALATSNIDEISLLAEAVLKHARCFDDELNIHQIVILSLLHASKWDEALEMAMSILLQLGESISRNQLDLLFYLEIRRTQAMIAGVSEDVILGYKPMTDKKKRAAMRILVFVQRCSFFAAPKLCGYYILKMVQLTFMYGLSNQSPMAFALFGVLLSIVGNIPVGHRFCLLATALLNKLELKDATGEVIYVVLQVRVLVEPIQALSELYTQAESAALSGGDIQVACVIRVTCCLNNFWAGAKLADVNKDSLQAIRVVKRREYKAILVQLMAFQWLLSVLIGNEAEVELDALASEQNDRNPRALMLLLFESYLFSKDDTQECETYFELKIKVKALAGHDQYQVLLPGLAAFRLHRQTKNPIWLKRGKGCKEEMKTLSEKGSKWNFEQKQLMLMAEESYCLSDYAAAKELYKNAIATAKSHKFLNDECMALDLAANFYLEIGELQLSLDHFRQAYDKYYEWGAYAKAKQLLEQFHCSMF